MTDILRQPWHLAASKLSVQAGPVRIRLEAAGTFEDRVAIARAVTELPALLEATRKAWVILAALEPDPPTRRVRDELADVLKRTGVSHA